MVRKARGKAVRSCSGRVILSKYRLTGLKAVIRANRAVAEIFDLLQHRIWAAVRKDIAGYQQDRQSVHMSQRHSRHHVRGSRPDGRRHRHGTACAPNCLE